MEHGIEFGEQEDVASCMMRIASDQSVNGMSNCNVLAADRADT